MPSTSLSLNKFYSATILGIAATVCAGASAQNPAPATPDSSSAKPEAKASSDRYRNTSLDPYKTFYLKTGSGVNDANEILTALRLILDPGTKLYLMPSTNALVIRGTPADLALAEKLLADLDRARRDYRLTYTITELDAGKRIGVQHFALAIVSGGRTTLKNGSKVPVATGSYNSGTSTQQTQFTYLDVGLNFDASLDESSNGYRLRSKVEQSTATEEKLISGVQEPLIRQSVLESTSILTVGKPLMLGSIDIAGSTRHLDVEVQLEPMN